jgi:D5 N terminal like
LCSRNGLTVSLQDIAEKFTVEQHKDNLERAHFYFYSPIPFPLKTTDNVLGLEVKGLGEHGISFCSPSVHKDGHQYEIVGTTKAVVLNLTEASELIQHINNICSRYRVPYLERNSDLNRLRPMINSLEIDPTVRIQKDSRHVTLISAADSILLKHLYRGKKKKTEQWLKNYFVEVNRTLCDPEPLPESEIEGIWQSAIRFVQDLSKGSINDGDRNEDEEISMVEESSEAIKKKHKFVTVSETKEILYYRDGVYVPGGDTLIEKEAEVMYGYDLSNKLLTEIKGHIIRSTYRNKDEFDADINILNLKNGLYNIVTGEFIQHTPNYLSVNQIPRIHNPKARPKRFGRFLNQVLYPTEIRTTIEVMAYTLYRNNPFEIMAVLFGYGSNGKTVFTGLLNAILGAKNVSNVPLRDGTC